MHAVIKYLGEYVLCCLFQLVSVCGMDTQLLHVCSVGRSWACLVWSNASWAVVSLGNRKQWPSSLSLALCRSWDSGCVCCCCCCWWWWCKMFATESFMHHGHLHRGRNVCEYSVEETVLPRHHKTSIILYQKLYWCLAILTGAVERHTPLERCSKGLSG